MHKFLQAKTWTPKIDPTGYWMSAKMDGVRAYWDGEGALWSRLGNAFKKAPQWFIDGLPKGQPLDGELYLGPGRFNDTIRAVKGSEGWDLVRYVVFDAPSVGENCDNEGCKCSNFEHRITIARQVWHDVAPQTKCLGIEHLYETLKVLEAVGMEGVMLRKPGSLYEGKKSSTLLKVKSFLDMEVVVVNYTVGKGKHSNRIGALVCSFDGKIVEVGTGLTDAERENPPAVGSRITIKYQELTPAGIPRFPVFVAVRDYE